MLVLSCIALGDFELFFDFHYFMYCTVAPWFTNAFGLQTETFSRILYLYEFAQGEKYDHGHLSATNMNVSLFSRIVERIQFVYQGPENQVRFIMILSTILVAN